MLNANRKAICYIKDACNYPDNDIIVLFMLQLTTFRKLFENADGTDGNKNLQNNFRPPLALNDRKVTTSVVIDAISGAPPVHHHLISVVSAVILAYLI